MGYYIDRCIRVLIVHKYVCLWMRWTCTEEVQEEHNGTLSECTHPELDRQNSHTPIRFYIRTTNVYSRMFASFIKNMVFMPGHFLRLESRNGRNECCTYLLYSYNIIYTWVGGFTFLSLNLRSALHTRTHRALLAFLINCRCGFPFYF